MKVRGRCLAPTVTPSQAKDEYIHLFPEKKKTQALRMRVWRKLCRVCLLPVAVVALERLGPGVFAVVSR